MRFLLKAEMAMDKGNAAICDGSLPGTIQSILDDLKPEAAYFTASNGKRTALLVVNIQDASQIPSLAEPWFLALGASIELTPVMVLDDLKKAGPAIERRITKIRRCCTGLWNMGSPSFQRDRANGGRRQRQLFPWKGIGGAARQPSLHHDEHYRAGERGSGIEIGLDAEDERDFAHEHVAQNP